MEAQEGGGYNQGLISWLNRASAHRNLRPWSEFASFLKLPRHTLLRKHWIFDLPPTVFPSFLLCPRERQNREMLSWESWD